ncbi:MAG TPA: D-Ala-D-Ala carboxypeptidase family metallohydrolase [Candidatus Eisenbacteria bacterium]|nr:D-Ala-D-Ala carboxypeptidase family metallohydrolase [Candidatus Eisenbacteria bacterium]
MKKILQILGLTCAVILLFAVPAATPTLQGTSLQYSPAVREDAISFPADVLGRSGNLRALIGTPTSFADTALQPLITGIALAEPGVHSLGLRAPDGDSLVVVTLAPFDAIQGARLDGYRVGKWPTSGLAARDARYAPPPGFIAVTPENRATPVSKRFRLHDFLTHDQQDVWPKVLVLRPALLDKLELVGQGLERRGLPSRLHVMSGFRTPQYNEKGVGAKGGRASQSRHMYGDAADVFVDANGDGRMDDLDGDGKTTIRDARVLFAVAEGVEAEHPDLVGGLSAYPANSAHGPFVHIDARGKRARW